MAFNFGRSLLSGAKKTLGAVSPVASGLMAAVKIAKDVPKGSHTLRTVAPPLQMGGVLGEAQQKSTPFFTKQQQTPAPTDAQLNAARAKAQPVQPAQLAAVSAVRQGTANAPTAPAAPVAPQAPEAPVASTPRQDTGAGRVTLIGPDGKKVTAPAGSAVMQGYIRQGYTQEGAQAPTAPVAPQVTSGAIVEPPAGTGTLTPEQQRDALRQSLLESMRIGKDEAGTQAELDALNADANAAIYDVEATGSRRGFTTGYATGLQGAIGRQAEIAKLPLEARIANLQAQRNADRAATQAQLGFVESDINQRQQMSQKDAEAKRAILLQALQGGATQEQMAQILGAKTPDEAIQIAGQLLTPKKEEDPMAALDMEKKQLENLKLQKELAGDLSQQDELDIQKRMLEIEKLQNDLGYGSSNVSDEKITIAQDKVDLINSLLSSGGMAGSVGTYGFSRWTPFSADQADRQEFAGGINQLISQETIDTLINLKERGGTLGALSDQERVLLQNAATKLGTWMQRDKNGNPTGKFEISEAVMKKELENIKRLAEKAIVRAGGSVGDSGQVDISQYRNQYPGLSDEIIRQIIQEESSPDFTNDLSRSVNGLTDGATRLGVIGNGTITGINGSKYWKQGLDFQLNENGKTKGATVKSPYGGTVIDVVYGNVNNRNTPLSEAEGKKQNGGFGNQVKIRLDDGSEVWVSHLDKVARVVPGQRISKGQVIGTQGNTGMTYGNTGVHLDLTMKKPDGSYYTARQVAALLGDERISRSGLA